MFTGIITHTGRVVAAHGDADGRTLEIESGLPLDAIPLGASVAHSGVCMTLTEKAGKRHKVYASSETLARTTVGHWAEQQELNLEASLKLGDELGGHLVFGHVDGLGQIRAIKPVGDSHRVMIGLPEALAPMVAVKGSVAVDGVSLTVNAVGDDWFSVTLIPHSWTATTLRERQVGDSVNLEADMLARYVARQLGFVRPGD